MTGAILCGAKVLFFSLGLVWSGVVCYCDLTLESLTFWELVVAPGFDFAGFEMPEDGWQPTA